MSHHDSSLFIGELDRSGGTLGKGELLHLTTFLDGSVETAIELIGVDTMVVCLDVPLECGAAKGKIILGTNSNGGQGGRAGRVGTFLRPSFEAVRRPVVLSYLDPLRSFICIVQSN